jgi:hypothetical protein
MTAPPRIIDDPSASPALRADIETAAQNSAGSYDAAAGLAALRGAIDRGSTPPGAAPPAGGPSTLFKGLIGIGAVIGGGALALLLWSSGPEVSPPVNPAAELEQPSTPEIATPRERKAGGAEPQAKELTRPNPESPEGVEPLAQKPEDVPTKASQLPTSAKIDPDELMRQEIAHLKKVRAALGADPASAYRLASEGHSKFS